MAHPSRIPARTRAPSSPQLLALLVALSCAGMAQAQSVQVAAAATPSPSAGTLKEIVVSASRTEQDKDDVPASLDVLTREQMEAMQIHDIRDMANQLPNVSVKRAPVRFGLASGNTGRDGNAGFNIRGLDGNRVLMMVDGIRQPRSYVFSANAFGRDYFDVNLLERVEIVRGPTSALYGSDGMGGLVNFITLSPSSLLGADKTLAGRTGFTYSGDNHGRALFGTVAGRAGDWQWLLAGSSSRSSELTNMGTVDAPNASRTKPNPETDRGGAVLGKLVYGANTERQQTLTLEHLDRRGDYLLLSAVALPPLAGTSTVYADSFTEQDRSRFTWDARWPVKAVFADSLRTVLGYQRSHAREYAYERRNTAAERVRDTIYDENIWQASIQADKLVAGQVWSHKITYGLDHSNTDVRTVQTGITPAAGETFPLKRFPDSTETSTALFVQDEIFSDAWSIIPGVRFDRYKLDPSQAGFSPPSTTPAAELSDTATSPKLGLMFRATPQWTLFGNYAGGFRAPNSNQVNAFFENITQFYKTIPNPNLKPERSRNLELGARARFGALSLDAAAFTGRYTDFIEDTQQVGGGGVPGNPTVFQTINMSKVNISGFEVKGNIDWGRAGMGTLSTPFAYGQAHGTDQNTGLPVNSVDPAKLNLGLRYATPGWDLRFDVAYHAAKDAGDIASAALVAPPAKQFTTPSATTLDVRAQWRITPIVRLNVAVVNLTDQKYWNWSDVRGLSGASAVVDAYTQPGRHMDVSLVADF